jgi:hypothetical protein
MRGVTGEHLRASFWRWVLLAGLAISAVLAFRAGAWITFALIGAAACLATFEPKNASRT